VAPWLVLGVAIDAALFVSVEPRRWPGALFAE